MAVRVDLNISLDGVATTTDQTPENPFGDDCARLTQAYAVAVLEPAEVIPEPDAAAEQDRERCSGAMITRRPLRRLIAVLEAPDPAFAIVTP